MNNDPRHNKGFLGEQTMGFILGKQGYIIIDGPSGNAGHKVTAAGFDGVAYHPIEDIIVIFDNKSYKSNSNISKSKTTAIDPDKNLAINLRNLIFKIDRNPVLPRKGRILTLLRKAQQAIQNRKKWPDKVWIVASNAGGNSRGISRSLEKSGIRFWDVRRQVNQGIVNVQPKYSRGKRFGGILGLFAQLLNDFTGILLSNKIQKDIEDMLEARREEIEQILRTGQGLLILIDFLIWPDQIIRKVNGVYVQGGSSEKEAFMNWKNTPFIFPGHEKGYRIKQQRRWIPPY